jgi:hypothetical protein
LAIRTFSLPACRADQQNDQCYDQVRPEKSLHAEQTSRTIMSDLKTCVWEHA